MPLFAPIWMTKNKKKSSKAIEFVNSIEENDQLMIMSKEAPLPSVRDAAWRKIHDLESYETIINDATYGRKIRLYSLNELVNAKEEYDLSPYTELIESFLDLSDRNCFDIAVSLSDNLELLEKIYNTITREKIKRKMYKKNILPLRYRINILAEKRIAENTDRDFFYKLIRGKAYTHKIKAEAISKLMTYITDDDLCFEFITNCDLIGNESHPEIIERIKSKEMLATLARYEGLEFVTRQKAAEMAGMKNPFGTKTYVCKTCGSPIIYEQCGENEKSEIKETVINETKTEEANIFESETDESEIDNVNREFRCKNKCWGDTDNLQNDNYEEGELGEDSGFSLDCLIFICPECLGLRGYTTVNIPKLEKCICRSRSKAIPIMASIKIEK